MGNISDINISVAEITNNIRMVIFTKNNDQELIKLNKINHRTKAMHHAISKKLDI